MSSSLLEGEEKRGERGEREEREKRKKEKREEREVHSTYVCLKQLVLEWKLGTQSRPARWVAGHQLFGPMLLPPRVGSL